MKTVSAIVSDRAKSPSCGCARASGTGDAHGLSANASPSLDIRLTVTGLHCASCVGSVQRTLAASPGVVAAAVNLASQTATVTVMRNTTRASDLVQAVERAGYGARVIDDGLDGPQTSRQDGAFTQEAATQAVARTEAEAYARRFAIAAILTAPVFVLEMGSHAVPAFHHWVVHTFGLRLSWLVQLVLTTLVLLGPGRPLFVTGFRALARRAPEMNSLVAIGAGAAWGYSVVATLAPTLLPEAARAVYFEAAAVIVTLILLGRWLEARARLQTTDAVARLMDLRPKVAELISEDGMKTVPVDEVRIGDRVRVKPATAIPVDGVIVAGDGFVDESMITGEATPVAKAPGDDVIGGTVNTTTPLVMEARRVGSATRLAEIARLVATAQNQRVPIQALVDRITFWFVPAIMLVALLTLLAWLIVGPEPRLTFALVAAVSVLIIACPCAMGLATPTSIMVGVGRAARLGILFRGGDSLQTLRRVDTVVFDKTGTLTKGEPEVVAIVAREGGREDDVLETAAALEQASEHPLARAIVAAAGARGLSLPVAGDLRIEPGYGVFGIIDEARVMVGAPRLMVRDGVDLSHFEHGIGSLSATGATLVVVARDGVAIGVVAIADAVRPTSAGAVDKLKAAGCRVLMITGDGAQTAEAVAREVGIEASEVMAGVLPEGKAAAVARLKADGRCVAFVGDGINDAPALATADVGIAIGTGTDVAIESADVVLMAADPLKVAVAREVSAATMVNIRQNLVWAFGYNVLLIPVAAGVLYPATGLLLSPMLAAGAMAASSVLVVVNALRLNFAGASPDLRGSRRP
ncbi:MAG: heavy metal translocating P-type ATPase [Hyphomicrobiaceae bacterium]